MVKFGAIFCCSEARSCWERFCSMKKSNSSDSFVGDKTLYNSVRRECCWLAGAAKFDRLLILNEIY